MVFKFFIFAYFLSAQPLPIPILETEKSSKAHISLLIGEAFRLEKKRLLDQNANKKKLFENEQNYKLLYFDSMRMLDLGSSKREVIKMLSRKMIFSPGYCHIVPTFPAEDLEDDLEDVPFSPEEGFLSFVSWSSSFFRGPRL